jgi:hypothetical protein
MPEGSVPTPENLSLKRILSELTPTQVWALLGAVVALLSGSFGLGVRLAPVLSPTQPAAVQDLVPCFKADRYPLGNWLLSGEITVGQKTMMTSGMRFTSSTEGTSLTNEQGGAVGHFVFDNRPVPGEKAHYRATDGTGYEGDVTGYVSNSGCSIEGDWYDNRGHSGHEILFWIQPHEFWVKRSTGP